jgi:hypothetical protein
MKKMVTVAAGVAVALAVSFCTKNIDRAKKDIDLLINTMEYCWLTMEEYAKKGEEERGLQVIDKYVMDRQEELAVAGRHLSEDMFNEGVRKYYQERYAHFDELSKKLVPFLDRHLTPDQWARLGVITADKVGATYMKNIQWTTDPVEFFKKAIKNN